MSWGNYVNPKALAGCRRPIGYVMKKMRRKKITFQEYVNFTQGDK